MRLMNFVPPLALAALLAGCSQGTDSPPADALRITVAPLTLEDVEEVSYGIRVFSAVDLVWEKSGLTSTRYGDGKSALTYIGPCDATENPHTIELVIENIHAGGRDLAQPADFINPAPATRPLRRTDVECVENADVLVAFDLTILRNAHQGFFDIAVNFDDIFCSAKLDCREHFLHRPGTGDREATAIVAFACSAGEDAPTFLHVSDLTLSCSGAGPSQSYRMVDAGPPGEHGPVPALGSGAAGVFQWATYQGVESLTSDGQPIEKCFWNRAIGLDLAALQTLGLASCTLTGIGTATESPELDEAFGRPGTSYPIVRWSVDVLSEGGALCGNNALNGPSSGVVTEYVDQHTDPATLMPLSGSMACGAAPIKTVACGNSAQVRQVADRLTVTGSAGSVSALLPAGFTLGGACCVDGCCSEP